MKKREVQIRIWAYKNLYIYIFGHVVDKNIQREWFMYCHGKLFMRPQGYHFPMKVGRLFYFLHDI